MKPNKNIKLTSRGIYDIKKLRGVIYGIINQKQI